MATNLPVTKLATQTLIQMIGEKKVRMYAAGIEKNLSAADDSGEGLPTGLRALCKNDGVANALAHFAMIGIGASLEVSNDDDSRSEEFAVELGKLVAGEDGVDDKPSPDKAKEERHSYDLTPHTQEIIEFVALRGGGVSHVLDKLEKAAEIVNNSDLPFQKRITEMAKSLGEMRPVLFLIGVMATVDYLEKYDRRDIPGVN